MVSASQPDCYISAPLLTEPTPACSFPHSPTTSDEWVHDTFFPPPLTDDSWLPFSKHWKVNPEEHLQSDPGDDAHSCMRQAWEASSLPELACIVPDAKETLVSSLPGLVTSSSRTTLNVQDHIWRCNTRQSCSVFKEKFKFEGKCNWYLGVLAWLGHHENRYRKQRKGKQLSLKQIYTNTYLRLFQAKA